MRKFFDRFDSRTSFAVDSKRINFFALFFTCGLFYNSFFDFIDLNRFYVRTINASTGYFIAARKFFNCVDVIVIGFGGNLFPHLFSALFALKCSILSTFRGIVEPFRIFGSFMRSVNLDFYITVAMNTIKCADVRNLGIAFYFRFVNIIAEKPRISQNAVLFLIHNAVNDTFVFQRGQIDGELKFAATGQSEGVIYLTDFSALGFDSVFRNGNYVLF